MSDQAQESGGKESVPTGNVLVVTQVTRRVSLVVLQRIMRGQRFGLLPSSAPFRPCPLWALTGALGVRLVISTPALEESARGGKQQHCSGSSFLSWEVPAGSGRDGRVESQESLSSLVEERALYPLV